MLRTPLLVIVTFVAISSGLFSQSFYYTLQGALPGSQFGASLCRLGDLNGDGIEDFAVGAPFEAFGKVRFYSGATLEPFRSVSGSSTAQRFGSDIESAGDWDGDGVQDIAVGAPGQSPGRILIHSGATGALLASYAISTSFDGFGGAFDPMGDLDGDGVVDFVAGAAHDDSGAINAGRVVVFSGLTGAIIHDVIGTTTGASLGSVVSWVKDLNGDGIDDFIAGAPNHPVPFVASSGQVVVHSGSDGALIRAHTVAWNGSGGFGNCALGLDDFDGDGQGDYVIGTATTVGSVYGTGRYDVFSGATGAGLIWETSIKFQAGESDSPICGRGLTSAGDWDGDGKRDFFLTWSNADGHFWGIYKGVSWSGSLLRTKTGPASQSEHAAFLNLGDVDGDGQEEIVIGQPLGSTRGRIKVHLGDSGWKDSYDGAAGPAATALDLAFQYDLLNVLPFQLIDKFKLVVSGASPGALGLAAASHFSADFSYFGLPILVSFNPGDVIDSGTMIATSYGYFAVTQLPLSVLQNPAMAGMAFYVQFYEISPVPRSSNGLRFVYSE